MNPSSMVGLIIMWVVVSQSHPLLAFCAGICHVGLGLLMDYLELS